MDSVPGKAYHRDGAPQTGSRGWRVGSPARSADAGVLSRAAFKVSHMLPAGCSS